MSKRKTKELKLYRVSNVKSENIIPHGKITTKIHPNITIEVLAASPKAAKTEALTQLSTCKTWLPDKATAATLVWVNADSLSLSEKLAEGLSILVTRYKKDSSLVIKGSGISILDNGIVIGDKKPHGFDAATVARLHRLGWELLKGGKFRFMHIPF